MGVAIAPTASCSFLFDPAQYATTDAAIDDSTDASSSEIDAHTPDDPDAFVPIGADADLDAPAPTDAARVVHCASPGSLELAECASSTNGLAYCDAETGAILALPSSVATALLPGARHELGLLGNGILVASAGVGEIVDLELAREGNRVMAVWLDASERTVQRREYTVGSRTVSVGEIERASFGADGAAGTDVSVRPGDVDETWLGYVSAGAALYARCPGTAFGATCEAGIASAVAVTGVTRTLVAHADDTVVGLYVGTHPDTRVGVVHERPLEGGSAFFDAPGTSYTGLRSTTGPFVYTTGGAGERIVEPDNGLFARSLGGDLPRLVRNEGGAAREYRIARARIASASTIEIASAQVIASAAGELGCSPCTSTGVGMIERNVASTFPELRDWSYAIVDGSYSVAALLVGDTGGTNVEVVMWNVGVGTAGETLEPIVIGSGRVTPPGNGRSLRMVAQRTPSSLEIFVLTLVSRGEASAARDELYLTGLRLLACAS